MGLPDLPSNVENDDVNRLRVEENAGKSDFDV